MDAEYEFIVFRLLERKAKKSIWACLNKNSETPLGEVRWYGAWRQYCYFPTTQAIYSAGCLADIKTSSRE